MASAHKVNGKLFKNESLTQKEKRILLRVDPAVRTILVGVQFIATPHRSSCFTLYRLLFQNENKLLSNAQRSKLKPNRGFQFNLATIQNTILLKTTNLVYAYRT